MAEKKKNPSIPSAIDVLDALQAVGGRSTAVGVCEALRVAGHTVADAQLGIQRAIDTGDVVIKSDFTLRIGDVNMDYVGGSIGHDRWGRKVLGALASMPAQKEEYLLEYGWSEEREGWVKQGGLGKGLSAEEAFQLQAILNDLSGDFSFRYAIPHAKDQPHDK